VKKYSIVLDYNFIKIIQLLSIVNSIRIQSIVILALTLTRVFREKYFKKSDFSENETSKYEKINAQLWRKK